MKRQQSEKTKIAQSAEMEGITGDVSKQKTKQSDLTTFSSCLSYKTTDFGVLASVNKRTEAISVQICCDGGFYNLNVL